jgi:hypothetical protein
MPYAVQNTPVNNTAIANGKKMELESFVTIIFFTLISGEMFKTISAEQLKIPRIDVEVAESFAKVMNASMATMNINPYPIQIDRMSVRWADSVEYRMLDKQ